MTEIQWTSNFPKEEAMISIIKKTISISWKNGLTMDDIQQWLSNFVGKVYKVEDERRLALWMLCNFTYYNENEINHLCRVIYKNLLHDIVQKNHLDSDEKIIAMFQKICFAAIGNAGESGGLLLYYFRQEAEMNMDRFFYPTSIPNDPENILVFIDDVTLSGGTAVRFFHNNIKSMEYKQAYYITLFASEEAVEKISKFGITVLNCTLLDDRDKCFSENSIMFSAFPELRKAAKDMAFIYGRELQPDKPLGYKNGQYSFGFHYNTPNNTLPIFWSDNQWYPIFPRKEKIHNAKQRKNEFEKYI